MTGRMFSFITETWNPLAGGPCPGECTYCWATILKKRYGYAKYLGPWRVDEKVIGKTFKPGSFVFVQDMGDLWAPSIPEEIVVRVLQNVRYQPEVTFLPLTKFPETYRKYVKLLPGNVVLGATVETNRDTSAYSKAPPPTERVEALVAMQLEGFRTFVSVEPVMEFDRDKFLPLLSYLHPSFGVAVGYDNYRNGLPEPRLVKVMELIASLRARGIMVYEKTLREASA